MSINRSVSKNSRGDGKRGGARINENIREKELRVVSEDGEQLGILTLDEALKIAQGKGLDLVEVAPSGKPPVCRIMDYGKYLYTEQKRAQQAKKKQKRIQVKEMKFRPMIDGHDYDFKKKHVIRFLEAGDRVKITVRFRGRELAHKDKGFAILQRLKADLEEYGYPDKGPLFEGIHMVQIFVPKPSGKN